MTDQMPLIDPVADGLLQFVGQGIAAQRTADQLGAGRPAEPAPLLNVRIPGTPRPQGSTRYVVSRNAGPARAIPKLDPTMLSSRADAAAILATAWTTDSARRIPYAAPVAVTATFLFPRPAGHYLPANRNRPAPVLRDTAPTYPTGRTTPDVDKMARLLGDALQLAEVLADDALIVDWRAQKRYAPGSGRTQGWTLVTLWAAT